MTYEYPHCIDNGHGERIKFLRLVKGPAGDWLELEGFAAPNSGPPMHVHYLQDEGFTVLEGNVAVQVLGEAPKFYKAGDSVEFKAGTPHKFWNHGKGLLHIRGWIKPANNLEYFLTELYKSTANNGGERPNAFDGAWLTKRYQSEFEMFELPFFVKNLVFPLVLFFGRLAGKQRKFEGSPPPLR